MQPIARVGGQLTSHCGRLTLFVYLHATASAPAPVLQRWLILFGDIHVVGKGN